ncbi:MAG TPA: DUF429 domain-containing protein, partial [Jiangellales bacterium]|nr:DUF429 domain-containing protein [Jiangellales bacterium]
GSSRALRIAERLGLDIDPDSAAPRRVLEVFPHPATISLFGLPHVLRYKHKPGRDLVLLRAELTSLLHHLEGLSAAEPPLLVSDHAPWREVRRAVVTASRKVDLRRVEDRVDAVVCAYVALLAAREPEQVHVFGDVHGGYIATPLTPEIAARVAADRRTAPVRDAPVSSSTRGRDAGAAPRG